MSGKPRISVLIGTWNDAPKLPRAMDSILGQTLAELELIVVDDGSTDGTDAVVAAYDDPRVRYVRLPHVGIARSLNAGIREARSDLVAVHDADDWSLPERLARQVATLEERPEVAVVGCLMREVDESGRELRRRLPMATGDVTGDLMRFNPIPNTSATFRRDAVLGLRGYDPRYRYAMDYDLWMRMAEQHGVWNLGEELAVRELGTTNFGEGHERAQILEAMRIRVEALRRRRTLRGASGLARPVVSFLMPFAIKRAVRRARGQGP
jgi:glycosyltransferase EpsE